MQIKELLGEAATSTEATRGRRFKASFAGPNNESVRTAIQAFDGKPRAVAAQPASAPTSTPGLWF